MQNYRGQYRVLYETDKQGKVCEFSFIPCRISKRANICRHNNDTMNAYIPSTKTAKRLLKQYPYIFKKYQTGDSEAILLFPEYKMDEAAKILKARVKGKNQSSRPKRICNLTEEQRQVIGERLAMARKQKLYGGKNALEEKLAVFYQG